jgi:carbon storage regulator
MMGRPRHLEEDPVMLVISRRLNESIVIGDNVVITIVELRGDKARLAVTAPVQMPIHRKEVHDAIHPPPPPEPPPRSPEELAFLEAIFEEPDDVGQRLIFADWLEEHDDPLGEFIHLQCQLATLPPHDEQRAAMQEREAELWATYAAAWRAYLPPVLHNSPFERGFVEAGSMTVNLFLQHAEAIFAAAPVRRLRVESDWTLPPLRAVTALASSAYLARLAVLDLSALHPGDDEVGILTSSPRAASLKSLILRWGTIGSTGAIVLASSATLQGLELLDVRDNRIGEEGHRALRARFGDRVRL